MRPFLFQIEYETLTGKTDTSNVFKHPMVALSLVGQLLFLYTIFQKNPSRKLTMATVVLMGMLVFICLLVGILSINIRIIGAALPYFLLSWIILRKGKTGYVVRKS